MSETTNWRTFPQFEKTFGQDPGPLLARIASTCRQLDEQTRTGPAEQQDRARTALAAYVRLLELVKMIDERRAT
jgi:hypothetical protein